MCAGTQYHNEHCMDIKANGPAWRKLSSLLEESLLPMEETCSAQLTLCQGEAPSACRAMENCPFLFVYLQANWERQNPAVQWLGGLLGATSFASPASC